MNELTMDERVAAWEASHRDLCDGLKAELEEVVEHNRLVRLESVAVAARATTQAFAKREEPAFAEWVALEMTALADALEALREHNISEQKAEGGE